MNFEKPPEVTAGNNPEQTIFDKDIVRKKIENIIEELEDKQIGITGEVTQEAAEFYQLIKDVCDAVLREKSVTDRESFIRALKYRKENSEDAEVIDFIIKNTRE